MGGHAVGCAVGFLVGNLICPGIGGVIGSLLGGAVTEFAASYVSDELIDGNSQEVKLYEEKEISKEERESRGLRISKEEKLEAYLNCCRTLKVPPDSHSSFIKKKTREAYRLYHPDKNPNESPEQQENAKKFIEVNIAFAYIKKYRE